MNNDLILIENDTKDLKSKLQNSIHNDLVDDYSTIRNNLKYIIDKGFRLLDKSSEVAFDSDHPRTYEVAGNILKIVVDANKELLNIHKLTQDINRESSKEQTEDNNTQITNNNLFVGSTSELMKIIKENTNAK
jgi:hypothetical protein